MKLYLEEGFPGRLIAQETGVSQQALSGWVHLYQQFGEEGLKAHTPPALCEPKLPPAVTAQILQLKTQKPLLRHQAHLPTLAPVRPLLASVCYLHNARPRRSLQGQSACQIFYQSPRAHFSQRDRHQAFEWIKTEATAKLRLMEQPNRRDFAALWRQATVTWLRRQGLITVSQNQTRVTPFSPKTVS